MRLLRLDLKAVGPFTGASLDLSAGHHGLHLIYGSNEAGKTSTLRAVALALRLRAHDARRLRPPLRPASCRRGAAGTAMARSWK